MPFFSFIGSFLKWVGGLFRKAKSAAKDLLPKVIELVNNIKDFDTTHPDIANLFTLLIPSEFDDIAKEKIRALLPQILSVFVKAEEIANMTDEEIIIYVAGELQKVTDDTKFAFNYTELAAMIVHALDDGKLTPLEWVPIVKYVYDNTKE